MPTAETVTDALETALVALGLTLLTRGVRDDDKLTANTTYFRVLPVVVAVDDTVDSSTNYDLATLAISIVHRLTDNTDAVMKTYFNASLVTQRAVVLASFWTDLAGVFDVVEGSLSVLAPEREGNVIEYAIERQVRIVPV